MASTCPYHVQQARMKGDTAFLSNAARRAAERKREIKLQQEEEVRQLQQELLAWVNDKANWEAECRRRDAAAHLDTHPIND